MAKIHREMFNMYDLLESQYDEVKRALSAEREQYEKNLLALLFEVVKAMKGKETADESVVQAEQKRTEAYEKLQEARRQTASAEAERDKIISSFKDMKAQKVELIRTCETLKKAVGEVLVAAEKAAGIQDGLEVLRSSSRSAVPTT